MSDSIIYVGMDVHKDFVMMAVLPADAPRPTRVERVPNEPTHLRRFFRRWVPQGRVRACYEASRAGYVLQRTLEGWGVECAVIAPALMPTRPGHQRKHDKRDAIELARLHRAGELMPIRIPTASEERVRDLVRCREVLQRELIRARHYLVKFLARRGLEHFLKDPLIYGNAERYLQLAIQNVLDISNHIVADMKLSLPADHRQLFELLTKHKVVSASLSTKLISMAGFRNVLVHEYLDIDRRRVYGVLTKS